MGFFQDLWNDVTGVTASNNALAAQEAAAQRAQDAIQPYTAAGEQGLAGQQALLGLSGQDAQQAAISALEASPQFTSMVQQGENAMLQNASATGGLRGGNTQAAMAQFRPQMLSQVIQQQMGNYQNLAGMGMNAAGQSAGMHTSLGNAQAANAMANYNLQKDAVGGVIDFGINVGKIAAGGGF